MLRKKNYIFLLLLLVTASYGYQPKSYAQDGVLNVAFVIGHEENTIDDGGLSGFSRFSSIINNSGALVRQITLDEPISSEIELVIIAGPKTALTEAENSRLWLFVQNGGSLLVMVDAPPNRGLIQRSGLSDLLWQDYGIRWRDDMVVGDWFSGTAMEAISGSGFRYQPPRLSGLGAIPVSDHPTVSEIYPYDLPVFFWQARSLEVNAPAFAGDPFPILRTDTGLFSESRPTTSTPIFNVGEDLSGSFIIGAAVEDFRTGARIVVLGDSEIAKNAYGLEFSSTRSALPVFNGNSIFLQSMIRWLLKSPNEGIQRPYETTWIATDGSPDEWGDIPSTFTSEDNIITEVKITRSDRRTYLMLRVQDSSNIQAITLESSNGNEMPQRTTIYLDNKGTTSIYVVDGQNGFQYNSGKVSIGEVVEVELPGQSLRFNEAYTISEICIIVTFPTCIATNIAKPNALGLEPRGQSLLPGLPTARISAVNGTNLRDAPDGNILTTLDYNLMVNVLSEDPSGQWIEIWGEELYGWVSSGQLQFAYERYQ